MTTPRRRARHLVRRWWPVALAVPLGAAAGAGYAVVSHPSYAASAYVLVVPQNPGEAATATNFAQAYGRLAGQPQVLAVAAVETGHTRAQLESLVHGTTSPDAPMIEITGTGTRPQEAAQTADAVARSLVSFANTSSKDTSVRLVTLAPAAEPDKPTTPSAALDVAVGGAAGLLVGALVMMTRRRGEAAPPEAAEPAEPAEPVEAAEAPVEPTVPATPRPRGEEPPAADRAGQADEAGRTGQAEETEKMEKAEEAEKVEEAEGQPGKAAAAKKSAEEPPAKEKAAAGSGR
ncbi:Wzz/FepE/Etk N-terminal domain-containing protein [Kitasatospora sp. NPDC127121]|uniref:Wzz/FepE/Etk N-terminal domain-containing protein n=1 Tax=Kitasatospora sp. NPDC127121 TaxID=3345371 RepID=UPI003644DC4D